MSNPSPLGHSPNRIDREGAFRAFELDPDFVHLNHGSYGAVPREVRIEQDRWRARMERRPTYFMDRELPPALRALASFCCAAKASISATVSPNLPI